MAPNREFHDFEGLKLGHGDRWVLDKQLGRGSYGQVWLANDTVTGDKVAVKFESLRTPRPVLYLEYMFYKRIVRETQTERIPKILTLCPFVDSDGGEWTCLVMECMGKSLETLINKHKKFSIKTTIQLAIEMLTIIEGLFSPFLCPVSGLKFLSLHSSSFAEQLCTSQASSTATSNRITSCLA